MNCRSCDKELASGEEKMVAQWVFCQECFTALLEKKNVAKEQTEEEEDKKEECCHLCKKALDEGSSKKVGLWKFCTDCFGDLNKPARLNVSLSVEPKEQEETEQEEVVVLKAVYVNCGQCGRRIPERGSKERNGEPYCPDCYFASQESPRAPEVDEPMKLEAESISAGKCMSCLNEGCELKMVKGFPLCSACLVSDQNLALEIAKKRHKKKLEQLKSELD